ncbi:hypothetical protein BDY19DRAFT_956874 [Irpex rosettiformis]|uniref:Uncharacterized protein n=1 Tax=Irpex rosettiformis TaxID=378272 RepID=A0ACB8TYZ2_9APHY|nr:hypothetical protein BDY19DRAFT_956874 [Irpex rosettiformis]
MRVSSAFVTLLAVTSSVLAMPGRDMLARGSKTVPLYSNAELDRRATAIVSARQFHYLHARDPLLDVCASINTNVILGNSEILGIPINDLLGIDLCLCLSLFPIKLGLSAEIDALINKFGGPLINAVLELLIDLSLDKKQCNKPEFSTSQCSIDDPCGFECQPPYVKVGDKCECKAPYMLCNGQCTLPPGGVCSSSGSKPHYRRNTLYHSARDDCKANEEICGVYGGAKYAYECVNTKTNLESCGGCLVPNPFRLSSNSIATGVDCSSIDHAESVSCDSGRCVVKSCEDGWKVDAARLTCESVSQSSESGSMGVLNVLSGMLNFKRDEE